MWSTSLLEALDEVIPGHAVTADDLRDGLSRGFPWHEPWNSYEHLTDPDAWWANLLAHFEGILRSVGIRHDLERVTRRIRHHVVDPSRYELFDDAVPALLALAMDGWRQIMVSNHVPELDGIVAQLGLGGYFTHVLSSARLGFEKPHLEIFRRALRLAEPGHEVWMIGDNERADCVPALTLGINAILVHAEHADSGLLARDLEEATRLIRS